RRALPAYHSAVRSGAWSSSPDFSLATEPFGRTLRGAALGIIGFGTLGRSVAQIGRGLGMDVLVAERKGAATLRVGRVPFHEVLERSDLLAVLCPLTPETHRLIGAEELALMKRDALLINCAREASSMSSRWPRRLPKRASVGRASTPWRPNHPYRTTHC